MCLALEGGGVIKLGGGGGHKNIRLAELEKENNRGGSLEVVPKRELWEFRRIRRN